MKKFSEDKAVISDISLQKHANFFSEITTALSKHPNRISSSKAETAVAREIRDIVAEKSGCKAELQAFKAKPLLGRGMFPFIALWFLLSLVLYFVSFAGNSLTGSILALVSIIFFVAGMVVLFMLFLGSSKLDKLQYKTKSYNVVSKIKAESTKDQKTVVICSNHDAVLGSPIKDFGKSRKIAFILCPVSLALFFVLAIFKMIFGAESTLTICLFVILPAISSGLGFFAIITHFSWFSKLARQNNGRATATAITVFDFFARNENLVPANVNLVFASFGAENSGHNGSRQFIKNRSNLDVADFRDAKVLCIGDLNSNKLMLADKDKIRGYQSSQIMTETICAVSNEFGLGIDESLEVSTMTSLHGYLSNAFQSENIDSTTIFAKDYSDKSTDFKRSDIENIIKLAVITVKRLMDDSIE